jgi:hypothetical protein
MVLHRERWLQNAGGGRSLVIAADAALSWTALILVVIAALATL